MNANCKIPVPSLEYFKKNANTRDVGLTIAIPAYNHERYIQECLIDILKCRNRENIEVLIIDDCSPDLTLEKCQALLKTSEVEYRIYRNSKNQGITYGLNFLLNSARAKHVIFCASDDKIIGRGLDLVLDKIAERGGPQTLEIFSTQYFGDRSGDVYEKSLMSQKISDAYDFLEWLSTEIPKPLLLQSTIFNAEFLRRVDPWHDNLLLDDWPTFLRSAQLALTERLPMSFTSDICISHYRVHEKGQHNNPDRQKKACLEVVEKVILARHRKIIRSKVLIEVAIADLARGKYFRALLEYLQAFVSHPSTKTLVDFPLRALAGLARRISKATSLGQQ